MSAPLPLRRLVATTAVMFVLILAFLVGRVRAGADPAQAGTPAARVPAPAAPQEREPFGDDFPGVPPQGTAPSPGGQDLDPPMTQAS